MITLKLTSSKSTNGMLKARPVIGFYSEGDAGTVWKSRIEQDLPQFQFELLKDVEDKRTVGMRWFGILQQVFLKVL